MFEKLKKLTTKKPDKIYELNLSNHIPIIDGLRGIAVLLILIFHSTIIRGNTKIDDYYYMFGRSTWLGVDLFFLISGFLITGILYDSKGSKNFFKNFYMRRTLRIFPLYYLVVFFSLYLAPQISWFQTKQFPNESHNQWWYWLYASNFLMSKEGLKHYILGPTWSLAIEEQFYLLWPLLIYIFSRRRMATFCIGLVFFTYSLRLILLNSGYSPTAIYVLSPTRLDALAIGAFIALVARSKNGLKQLLPWTYNLMPVTGVILSYFLLTGSINKKLTIMIQYGYSVVAFFFGSLLVILLTQNPVSYSNRILSSNFLKTFGKYSYALYLFNQPIVALINNNIFNYRTFPRLYGSMIPGQVIFLLLVIIFTFILAYISWHIFEKHFLKLKRFFPRNDVS